jgi:uncharacterized protein (TIGR02001 family)
MICVAGKCLIGRVAIGERSNSAAPQRAHGGRAWALLALAAAAFSAPAHADGPWNASFGLTSNYILRGVSQTYGGAAVQLGGSYQSPQGWFVGAWGSNVDPYPSGVSSKELDLYGGYTQAISSDFTARIAYTRYTYLHDPRPTRYDYSELAATVTYIDRLALTVSYSPDSTVYSHLGFAHDKPTYAIEASGRYPLVRQLSLTAGAGFYDLQRQFGVRYWAGSAGLAWTTRRLEVDVSRYFSDRAVERLYDDGSANGVVAVSAVIHF